MNGLNILLNVQLYIETERDQGQCDLVEQMDVSGGKLDKTLTKMKVTKK